MLLFSITFLFIKLLMTFPVIVDGPSMMPTFYQGDTFFASMYEARFVGIKRGDVVVFKDANDGVVGGGGANDAASSGVVGGTNGGEGSGMAVGGANDAVGAISPYYYTKRIIGIPGDRLVIKDGFVEVNGEKLNEPYVRGQTVVDSFVDPVLSADAQGIVYNVPLDGYFVLGDNRENSVDSRNFVMTFVKREDVVGVFVQNVF